MELIIGCLVVAAIVRHVPGAIQDMVVAWRASKAGEWDVIARQQARRDAQADKRAVRRLALADKFAARRDRATDPDRRPGVSDIARDVYHGMCEDALEKRRAKRGNRPPSGTQKRVDEKIQDRAGRAAADPLERRHCPDCGRQLTKTGQGWWHADGPACPAADAQPQRRPSPRPRGGTESKPADDAAPTPAGADREVMHRRYCTGCPDCQHLKSSWRCDRCGEESRRPFAGRDDALADYANHRCPINDIEPAPQPDRIEGDQAMTAPTAEEVQTNEAARRAFQQMKAGGEKLAEGARLAEEGRALLAAAAQGAADGMARTKFDVGATSAANEAADAVGNDTLSRWCETADAAIGAADRGLSALEKYRDAEDTVASNNVDGSTLEPSQS